MKKLMKKLGFILAAAMAFTFVIVNGTKAMAAEMTEDEILAAATELKEGKRLEGTYTLTGLITEIVTEYSEKYDNITVNMKVKDTVIQAYRMKGGSELKVGDRITVTGTIRNYMGTVGFASACTYAMENSTEVTTTPGAEPTKEPTTTPGATPTAAPTSIPTGTPTPTPAGGIKPPSTGLSTGIPIVGIAAILMLCCAAGLYSGKRKKLNK